MRNTNNNIIRQLVRRLLILDHEYKQKRNVVDYEYEMYGGRVLGEFAVFFLLLPKFILDFLIFLTNGFVPNSTALNKKYLNSC